jgi:hypothetical protein
MIPLTVFPCLQSPVAYSPRRYNYCTLIRTCSQERCFLSYALWFRVPYYTSHLVKQTLSKSSGVYGCGDVVSADPYKELLRCNNKGLVSYG